MTFKVIISLRCDPLAPKKCLVPTVGMFTCEYVAKLLSDLFTKLSDCQIVTRRLERTFYDLAEFEVTDPDGHVICLSEKLKNMDDLPTPES